MANVTITAANVKTGGGNTDRAYAAEAITAGQVVYKDPASGKLRLADANAVSDDAQKVVGIALNGAAIDQPVVFQKSGPIAVGGTLTRGTTYCLSATAGAIAPQADMVTGDEVVVLGVAASATVLELAIKKTNVVV